MFSPLSACLRLFVLVSLLALAAVSVGEVSGDETDSPLKITVLADAHLPERRIEVVKGVAAFGRTLIDESVLVDAETRGLGDVLLWAQADEHRKRVVGRQAEHAIVLANGQYTPHVVVAKSGDKVMYRTIDPVLDKVRTSFKRSKPAGAGQDIRGPHWYVLDEHLDKPIRFESSIFPWMQSYLFVQDETECAITDRLGETVVPAYFRNAEEIKVWHPTLGYLEIVETSPEIGAIGRGRLRIESREVRQLTITVSLQ